jgi:hypothetical protein
MSTSLSDLITLREIAPLVGSYFTAYSMAATGEFGAPAAVVGRTRLYPRATTEEAVRHCLATRARRAGKVR